MKSAGLQSETSSSAAASTRARRAAGARGRPSTWCDPSRSGCSRGRRRGAPTFHHFESRASARAVRISRDSAIAARRTSWKPTSGECAVDVHPREPLVFGSPRACAPRGAREPRARPRARLPSDTRAGSRSTRSSFGYSRSDESTGCGWSSMHPRFTIHASPAASSTTISSAVRPDGKLSVTVRNHSGRLSGARF